MELKATEWDSNGESNAITQIWSENTPSFARRMKCLVYMSEIRHIISLMSGHFHEDSVYHYVNIYLSERCNIPEEFIIQEHRVLTSNFG